MKKNESTQTTDTGRLLTVVILEQIDGGHKVQVTFFETPQVFELSLNTTQEELNYKLLTEAKEKQVPVNVVIITEKDKNTINQVRPATAEQISNYLRNKNERQTATPVHKPN